MGPRFFHPPTCLRIANEVEQPAKSRESILAPKSELNRIRPESVCDCSRVVVDGSQCIGNNLRDRLRFLPVLE